MVNPQFISEKSLTLVEVKKIISSLKLGEEKNYLVNKTREYLDNFVLLPEDKKKELKQKLTDLQLVRLREEHLVKLIDFLPKTVEELKTVLAAYPLSLPKKDQESIVALVKEIV